MIIKVEPYLMRKGNRVAKAAIEFEESDGLLAGFQIVGFTICDATDGLFVLFPSTQVVSRKDASGKDTGYNKPFFFLRPTKEHLIADLEHKILDVYEKMMEFNTPNKR